MPWGANIRALISLRVAAGASMVFWLGLLAFVAVELAFDGGEAPARDWPESLSNVLIFTVWTAACVATVSCILAMRSEGRRLALDPDEGVEPAQKSGVPGQGERCSAL